MTATQAEFTRALFDPNCAAPAGLINPDGTVASKRFDVYRNNVVISLVKALEAGFPILLKLLGPEQFRALALAYLRAYPPATPMMMQFGQDMPACLQDRVVGTNLGYLPDIARLELALRRAYHAADTTPVPLDRLQELSPEALMVTRLTFAPAVQLLRSRWPVFSIWRFQTEADAPPPQSGGENVLITRPDFDPVPSLLPPGGGLFLAALNDNQSIGHALAATHDRVPDFDPAATLSLLVHGAAIAALSTGDQT